MFIGSQFQLSAAEGLIALSVIPVSAVIMFIILAVEKRRRYLRKAASLLNDSRLNTDPKGRKAFIKALGFAMENNDVSLYFNINGTKIAVGMFEKVMESTPDPLDKSYCAEYIGRCYETAENYGMSAEYYEKALEYSPSNTYALGRLAEFDDEKAEEYYKRILYYDPSNADNYYCLGRLYSRSGDPDKAIEQYEKAIWANNGFVAPMAEAAIEYAKKGDKKNVFKYFALAMANALQEHDKLEEAIRSCLAQS